MVNQTGEKVVKPDDDKKLRVDIYWGMYQEHQVSARHHETQRSTVNNFLILVAGAMVSLVFTGGFRREDLPLTFSLIALGILCALFNLSLFVRYHRHKQRADAYRDAIDEILFPDEKTIKGSHQLRKLKDIKDCADDQRISKRALLKRKNKIWSIFTSVHWVWFMLPMVIAGLGLILTFYCWKSLI